MTYNKKLNKITRYTHEEIRALDAWGNMAHPELNITRSPFQRENARRTIMRYCELAKLFVAEVVGDKSVLI